MSVRSHAPDCAKTAQLKAYEASGPERTPVTAECTCGAEYVRGVPTLEEAELLHVEAKALRAEVERLRRVIMHLRPHVPEHVLDSAATLAGLAREAGAP